jgi:hypothetical protein
MQLAFEKSGAHPVNTYFRDSPPDCRHLQSKIASTIGCRYIYSKSAARFLFWLKFWRERSARHLVKSHNSSAHRGSSDGLFGTRHGPEVCNASEAILGSS